MKKNIKEKRIMAFLLALDKYIQLLGYNNTDWTIILSISNKMTLSTKDTDGGQLWTMKY